MVVLELSSAIPGFSWFQKKFLREIRYIDSLMYFPLRSGEGNRLLIVFIGEYWIFCIVSQSMYRADHTSSHSQT
ncbi:unnamed protein product [Allacma fusca]|uniref:Uncharacterized protein n=1 Tax=Allacma fusca TaxID=39272 RepID=A0A8J2K5Q2_9HEXA|nr:unnamed protein product [Allacma fusca]